MVLFKIDENIELYFYSTILFSYLAIVLRIKISEMFLLDAKEVVQRRFEFQSKN